MQHDQSVQNTDTDTAFKGRKGPYEPWEGDHTALVHVLWSARNAGLDLDSGEDVDKIASMILHSRWFYAAQQYREPAGND
jgi:hypothetical protein